MAGLATIGVGGLGTIKAMTDDAEEKLTRLGLAPLRPFVSAAWNPTS